MAKLTSHTTDKPDPVVGEIAMPGKGSLGWSPAEHVVVDLETRQPVEAFFSVESDPAQEASVSNLSTAEAVSESLLVGFDDQEIDAFDLNELLDQAVPDPAVVTVPDETISESGNSANAAASDSAGNQADSGHMDLSLGSAFPQFTIVIEDDPGPDTVAI